MKLNIIIVYNNTEDKILMCLRVKEPYKGLLNLVGGHIEDNEDDSEAAYRELFEETGITKNEIKLHHLMTSFYVLTDIELQAYIGKLNKNVALKEEINTLHWIEEQTNFFDLTKFAGEGNIGHLIEQVKYYKKTNPNLIFG